MGVSLNVKMGRHKLSVDLKDYAEELDKGSMMVRLAVMKHQKDAATVTGDFAL